MNPHIQAIDGVLRSHGSLEEMAKVLDAAHKAEGSFSAGESYIFLSTAGSFALKLMAARRMTFEDLLKPPA